MITTLNKHSMGQKHEGTRNMINEVEMVKKYARDPKGHRSSPADESPEKFNYRSFQNSSKAKSYWSTENFNAEILAN